MVSFICGILENQGRSQTHGNREQKSSCQGLGGGEKEVGQRIQAFSSRVWGWIVSHGDCSW